MENYESPLSGAMAGYEKLRKEQETAEQRIREYNRKIKFNTGMILVYESEMERAEEEKKDLEVKAYMSSIQELEKEIEQIKKEVRNLKLIPQAMNSIIDEVSQNPDIHRAVAKRLDEEYIAKIDNTIERKNKIMQEKRKAVQLQNFINENPVILKCVKEIIEAKKELDKIIKIETSSGEKTDGTKESDNESRKKELKALIDSNKKNIVIYAKIAGISISSTDIDMLSDEADIKDDGKVDLGKKFDNEIKKCDKKIMFYTMARQNLRNPQNQQVQSQNVNSQQSKAQQGINNQQNVTQTGGPNNNSQGEQSNLSDSSYDVDNHPTENLHWWNFIKRFKLWRSKRKAIKGKAKAHLDRNDEDAGRTQVGDAQRDSESRERSKDERAYRGLDIIPDDMDSDGGIPTSEPQNQVQSAQSHDSRVQPSLDELSNPLYRTPGNEGSEFEYAIADRRTIAKEDIFRRELIAKAYEDKKKEIEERAREQMKARPKVEDVSQSTNFYQIAKVIQQLNPDVDIKIKNPQLDASGIPMIYTSVPMSELKLPNGFYSNEKNGITNKHIADSGRYRGIDVKDLSTADPEVPLVALKDLFKKKDRER